MRRLGVQYEVRGLPQVLTSYDAESLSGGTVLNQARFEHNNYGQRVSTYQAQTGAVNVSYTPRVQTSFADGAANTVRPVSLTYPDGRVVSFDYGAAGSVSDRTSRIAALKQGSATLAEYEFLGRGAVVQQTSPEANLRMTLVDLAGSNDPETGDLYSGLDRFGRVDDVRWRNTSSGGDLSRVKYGYNRASSRTWRVNPSDAANQHDWQYGYDGLQRLTRADRGTLNFSGSNPTTLNPQLFSQCWTLDATENWAGFRQDDDGDGTWNLVQSRTNNVVNELTGIANSVGGGWQVPAYDPAGNMTTIPQPASPSSGYTATYDAWNRLVKLTAAGGFQEDYRYDARNYRITQVTATETRHYYHTNAWQVIEERVGTTPDTAAAERQFAWGLRYIDDLVLRDRDTDNSGTLDERLYACQDANWNVTAVVNPAGAVSERYEYDPYGTLRVLTPTFGTRTSSSHAWETTYAGYRYNPATGLYHVRFRVLSPMVGWGQRDRKRTLLDLSAYSYAWSDPLMLLDPLGMTPWWATLEGWGAFGGALPEAIADTYVSGEAWDGAQGAIVQLTNTTLGWTGLLPDPETVLPTYGHGNAFNQGQAIGYYGGQTMNIAMVSYGTVNLGHSLANGGLSFGGGLSLAPAGYGGGAGVIGGGVAISPATAGYGTLSGLGTISLVAGINNPANSGGNNCPKSPKCVEMYATLKAKCAVAASMGGCTYGSAHTCIPTLTNIDCFSRMTAFEACASARAIYQSKCWNPTDPRWKGHMDQIDQMRTAAYRCAACMASSPAL